MCWRIFTGLTHMVLEGYFVFSPEFYKEKNPNYLAEAWKEYSKGDSRFIGRDSALVTVLGILAILQGPASLLTVNAIATKKPCSYILQVALSLGELYATAVIFITSFLDGNNFAVNAYYYYVSFVFVNGLWIVIPSIVVVRSWKKLCSACQVQEQKKAKAR